MGDHDEKVNILISEELPSCAKGDSDWSLRIFQLTRYYSHEILAQEMSRCPWGSHNFNWVENVVFSDNVPIHIIRCKVCSRIEKEDKFWSTTYICIPKHSRG